MSMWAPVSLVDLGGMMDANLSVTKQQTWASVSSAQGSRTDLFRNAGEKGFLPPSHPPPPPPGQARGRKARWPRSAIYSAKTLEATQMPGNQRPLRQSVRRRGPGIQCSHEQRQVCGLCIEVCNR